MSDFTWKGTKASAKNIVVNEYPPLVKPASRVREITVPGRAGSLVIPEPGEAHEPIVLTVLCTILPAADMADVTGWLSGAGTLVLGNDTARARPARLDAQLSFESLMDVSGHREVAIPFTCQPYSYANPAPAAIEIASSGTQITALGTMPALPAVKVEGTGEVSVSIGAQTVILELSDGGLIVDSELQDCMTLDGTLLINDAMTGPFFALSPGKRTVSWTGSVTKVTITPRWRWLG